MKPILKRALIQFRTRPETEKKDERTGVGKVAAVLGGAAAIGGAGYYWHKNYAKTRTAIEHDARMNSDPKYADDFKMAEAQKRAEAKAKNDVKRAEAKAYDAKLAGAPKPAASAPKPAATVAPAPKASAPAQKPAAPAPKAKIPTRDERLAKANADPKKAGRIAAVQARKLPSKGTPIDKLIAKVRNDRTIAAKTQAAPAQELPKIFKDQAQRNKSRAEIVGQAVADAAKPKAPAARLQKIAIAAKKPAAQVAAGVSEAAKQTAKYAPKPSVKKLVQKVSQGTLGLKAKIKPIEFSQTRHTSNGRFEIGTSPLTAYRKASRVVPWVNRASETAGDLGDMATGKKVRDPFYKKSWFKRAAQTAAIAAPLGAYALALKHRGRLANGEAGVKGGETADKIFRKVGLRAKIKPIQFAGLLPKGEFKTPSGKFHIPAKLNLPPQAGAVIGSLSHPDHLARIPNVQAKIKDSFGDLAARRASVGGTISLAPRSGKPTASLLRGPAGNTERATLRHELVHAIRQQRRGGSPKTMPALAREELAAYAKQDGKLRGLPTGKVERVVRGVGKTAGVVGSTFKGAKNYGIPLWKMFAARPNKLIQAYAAHKRLVEFATIDPLDRGWDLRDARGRSARVYAPGSRRRERREKEWGEKTDNIRLVRNVAIAGTVAGVVGAGVLGHKLIKQRAATNAATQTVAATKTAAEAAVAQARKQARKETFQRVRKAADAHQWRTQAGALHPNVSPKSSASWAVTQ